MTIRHYSTTTCVLALSALVGLPALGQIAQDHPELCGKPSGYVPLPYEVSAVSSGAHTQVAIRLNGSAAKIEMPGVIRVDQVCPLDGNRMLLFATLGAGDSVIYLVARATGAVLDSFLVQTPVISPDQHWLAMRDWITPTSQIPVTDQYLLYDLTKDAAGNRSFPGVDPRKVQRYGRTMYPVTPNRVPFENHGVSRDQVHTFWSQSFYWAGDSKSVVFADRTDAGLAIVLVQVGEKDLTTLVHPVSPGEVCGTLSDAAITAPQYGVLEIQATFYAPGSTPCTKVLTLHGEDFSPAKEEVYVAPQRRPSVLKKQL